MALFDTHCHLDYDFGPKSLESVLSEARAAGVTKFLTISTEVKTVEKVAAIAEAHEGVYYTVGVHPHDSRDLRQEDIPLLERLGASQKCLAVGEIGLDYHYDHSPRETQQARLEDQLELALRLRKPIVIHSREGEADLLTALRRYALRAKTLPGVIHCFSGTESFARECLDLGFYLSFSGIVTFKKADEVREAAKLCPKDRILVETDAPFLAPVPHRGKKCEPVMVALTARFLADYLGIEFDEFAGQTTGNAERLFL